MRSSFRSAKDHHQNLRMGTASWMKSQLVTSEGACRLSMVHPCTWLSLWPLDTLAPPLAPDQTPGCHRGLFLSISGIGSMRLWSCCGSSVRPLSRKPGYHGCHLHRRGPSLGLVRHEILETHSPPFVCQVCSCVSLASFFSFICSHPE